MSRSRVAPHIPTASTAQLCLAIFAGAWLFAPAAVAGRGADGEYEERRSSHFTLYQDVDIDRSSGLYGSRRFEGLVLKTLEEGYHSLENLLGMRVREQITVTIHDPRIFDERFSGIFRFPAAGFYGGSVHIRGATIMNDRLIQVLHHELVHAAFDAQMPIHDLPAWFNEGVAEWFEGRSVGRRLLTAGQLGFLARQAREGGLFSLADLNTRSFGHLSPELAQLAYLQSFAFMEFLTRNHGDRRMRDLCRSLVRVGNLEVAFKRTYRKSLEDLEADYHADLRSSAY
jgi:hypothetical protein